MKCRHLGGCQYVQEAPLVHCPRKKLRHGAESGRPDGDVPRGVALLAERSVAGRVREVDGEREVLPRNRDGERPRDI